MHSLAQGDGQPSRRLGSWQALTLDFRPSLQMASQSARDCSDAAGDVNSIWTSQVSVSCASVRVVSGLKYARSQRQTRPMPCYGIVSPELPRDDAVYMGIPYATVAGQVSLGPGRVRR